MLTPKPPTQPFQDSVNYGPSALNPKPSAGPQNIAAPLVLNKTLKVTLIYPFDLAPRTYVRL